MPHIDFKFGVKYTQTQKIEILFEISNRTNYFKTKQSNQSNNNGNPTNTKVL
jgi:hypothetical protein